jgi:hypothetical protein
MQLLKNGVLAFYIVLLIGVVRAEGLPNVPLPVAYAIDARLDTVHKTLDATEVLRYRNLTGRPQDRFPFHLYLNGFQPTSTFMQEVRRDNPRFKWDDKWYGAIEVKSLLVSGVGDLTAQMRYIHPDDDNIYDRTVFEVRLPQAVPPGGEVEFRISFHDKFPEVFARTGYKRDFFMGAQWFPKVGVWWKDAWNCHQFHESTEFFSDFGTYDVKLTLPQTFVVGSSGVQVGSTNNADGTKTVSLHGDVIHDFAWTASPDFEVVTDKFTGSAGTVNIRLLVERSRLGQAQRYLQALRGTMERFDKWYGPYPYPQITVIDPPHGAGRAGGMEYPTLITGLTAWWVPEGLRLPEMVVVHEFGHQYWYGMVATNEFEDAWLDEGINSYTELKVMSSLYGADTAVRLGGATLGDAAYQRLGYIQHADTDPLVRPGWMFMNRSAYEGVTYGKTASVFLTLEKLVGEATVQRALRTYFMRYRFTHPTREDFLNTLQEVSGQDLHWYFDQAVYGTAVLDYEVLSVNSDRPDWARSKATTQQEKSGEIFYTSNVVVHRKGDFIFPVDVLVKFSNGETARERWDGRDRWIRYTYQGNYRVDSAEVDPTGENWLDKNFYNNSRTREANPAATHKLANYWMVFTQLFAQLLAWLV